jgi:NADH-quinone oxidoreductase subunit A
MLREYVPLLMLIGLVVLTAAMMIVMSHMIGPRRPTEVKAAPYESGIPSLGGTRGRFSVKFYLIALLFVVFDVEMVFMIPWAVAFRRLGLLGLLEMLVFLLVLCVGLCYAWMRGALDWD